MFWQFHPAWCLHVCHILAIVENKFDRLFSDGHQERTVRSVGFLDVIGEWSLAWNLASFKSWSLSPCRLVVAAYHPRAKTSPLQRWLVWQSRSARISLRGLQCVAGRLVRHGEKYDQDSGGSIMVLLSMMGCSSIFLVDAAGFGQSVRCGSRWLRGIILGVWLKLMHH